MRPSSPPTLPACAAILGTRSLFTSFFIRSSTAFGRLAPLALGLPLNLYRVDGNSYDAGEGTKALNQNNESTIKHAGPRSGRLQCAADVDPSAVPIPKRGEVLVRISASGVNPLDLKIRAGKADHAKVPLPAILGMDLAGVVESVGPQVQGFKPGDKVFGFTGGIGGTPGSLAEFAAVDSNLLAVQPTNLTMRQAAALPLSFITAWEGLVDHAHVRAGHRVLIHAGAGGVGHLAVQLAVALGGEVFATVSPEKTAIVERFGATAINYKTTSVEAYVNQHTGGEGFDIIYDTVGGATLDASFAAIRPYTGHVVSCLGWGQHVLAPLSFRNATYSGVFTLSPLLTGKGRSHHGEILREAAKLAEAGKLMPLLNARQFSFETIEDAHRAVESGEAVGKVVVEL